MNTSPLAAVAAAALAICFAADDAAAQRDWYVSAARGKGKKGTKEKPAKDLGNIIKKLEAGDTIHIAAGRYTGRGDSGHDQIKVPVRILGGWSDDFTSRDPWGAHRTVLTGVNKAKNFISRARLEILCNRVRGGEKHEIVVDGVIVDNGDRNSYTGEGDAKIKRMYTPKTGANATPDSPGIAIWGHTGGRITVQNTIVMNCAPTGRRGAIEVKGVRDTQCTIRNNLVINNTSGIACLAAFRPRDGKGIPKFTVENNTVLFVWKYDPFATHGGDCFRCEPVHAVVRNNVLAYGDYYGVHNVNGTDLENLTLTGNLLAGNLMADYHEWDTKIALADLEDEAEKLADDAEGNATEALQVPVSEAWAARYAARNVIDRMKAEDSVQPLDGWQNDLRKMLGLPQDGGKLDVDSDVWLHRFPLEDAVKIAGSRIQGRGCQAPAASAAATPNK